MTQPAIHGPFRPTVDVVIASHGRPAMVREAIEAVLAQSYPGHLRVLVVHDGTEPDTDLVRSVEGRSVEVLVNDRTAGLAGARNTGILTGTGDLVALCDDDDLWLPEKLERQVAQLEIDGLSVSVTGILVDYRGRRVGRIPTPGDLTVAGLARRRVMSAHPSTVVVRRGALSGIGLVDEELPGSYGEDYDWMLRAAACGAISVVAEPLVVVRWGDSQFSGEWRTIVAAIDHLLVRHPAFHHDRRALSRLWGQRAFALAASGDGGGLRAAEQTLRLSLRERRGYLAAAVALHLISGERVLDLAHRRGRGI